MVGWVEVVTTAFALQLLALPGEKGQVIIAGLATKYDPYSVVAGAGAAFAGWTVLEILFGNALKGALPEVYLDGLTAGLFVVFAAWILYTTPTDHGSGPEPTADARAATDEREEATDGGEVLSLDLPADNRFAGFVPAFSMMVFGEFGDKTQIITIGLAVQYGAHPGIWLGEMLAIIPVSLVTALFFHRTAHRFDAAWFHRLSAALFLLFAADISAAYAFGVSVLPL